MSIGAIGFNPFDYDPSKLQAAHKIGLNGGMATGANGGTKAHQHNPEAGLDQQMLAQKAAGFQNGLGGTNNPDDHKIFFAA